MTDYKPGTVAKATVRGVPDVTVVAGYGTSKPRLRWLTADERLVDAHNDGWYFEVDLTDVRPLVVLDLDWAESVPVLIAQLRGAGYVHIADQIEAQTKPPRIPEPGWSEKVLAHTLDDPTPREYVRFTDSRNQFPTRQWYGHGGRRGAQRWDDLIDPVLIREGVA